MRAYVDIVRDVMGRGQVLLTDRGQTGMEGFYKAATGREYKFIASWADGWEHVSITPNGHPDNRPADWRDMCSFKDLFWQQSETVMQIHPAKDRYVNLHPMCLHLWRPTREPLPLPPLGMV